MTTSARTLLAQLNELNNTPLEDIGILSSESPYEVNALLFGPADTAYQGGAFRLRLVYDSDYPAVPPKGYFLTKIFHPNVSLKGEICVNTLKRDWTADVTIAHIFTIVKCLLINPGPDSALNEDAGRLLMESYEEFRKKAEMWTSVHAIKIEKAMSELSVAQQKSLPLSFHKGGSLDRANILGASDVNKVGIHTPETLDGASATKKLKTDASKKKATGAKKTLRRL